MTNENQDRQRVKDLQVLRQAGLDKVDARVRELLAEGKLTHAEVLVGYPKLVLDTLGT